MQKIHPAGSSSLLRTLALAITFALASHPSSAQGPSASESSSAQPTPAAALPEAPSALVPDPVFINGRIYHKPTRREDFKAFEQELYGPRPFISAAIRSGIDQLRTKPVGWGDDFPGYLQRYGSAYGEFGIDSSVRYGLAALFHEDVRYLICHKCSASHKIENAVLAQFTARHGEDGHRIISLTPVVAGFSGPLIAYSAWYPPGYDTGDAARHAMFGFGFRIVGHLVSEFFFDKDTKRAANP
jgi:hypothetical protein